MLTTIESPEQSKILTRSEIIEILNQQKVPWENWGKKNIILNFLRKLVFMKPIPTTRSLDDFVRYHQEDQFHISCDGDEGLIIVEVHVAVVMVCHKYHGRWLELYEERQVYPNGHELRRDNFNGIAETLHRKGKDGNVEDPRDGAQRCLAEELQFRSPSRYILSNCIAMEIREPVESEKWPGSKLLARYVRNIFEAEIDKDLFNVNGYVEREGNRTVYFKWRPRRQLTFIL